VMVASLSPNMTILQGGRYGQPQTHRSQGRATRRACGTDRGLGYLNRIALTSIQSGLDP